MRKTSNGQGRKITPNESSVMAGTQKRRAAKTTCQQCGKHFFTIITTISKRKYCSQTCSGRARSINTLVNTKKRFMSRTQLLPNGCWYWLGAKKGAYGTIGIGRQRFLAHRISCVLFKDFDINSPLFICHHCDNPTCVNPEHLFPGTPSDNIKDAYNKGRIVPRNFPHYIGQENPNSVLTEAEIPIIRSLYSTGRYTLREIGAMFNISYATVKQIADRVTWKHV